MLQQTFIHLPGVGPKTERRLWRQGFLNWQQVLSTPAIPGVSAAKLTAWQEGLLESLAHLEHPDYFIRRLPAGEHWRLFRQYQARTAYLDIETTGLSWPHLKVTVIGLYDGQRFYQFVWGHNLADFCDQVSRYQVLVTFNGRQFDLPVLRAFFPRLCLPPGHIDLRFVLAHLGYKGGLKHIEARFGLQRPPDLADLNGYDAVLLWQRYQRGDHGALELLCRYNQEDVLNLEVLMARAVELACNRLGLMEPEATPLCPLGQKSYTKI